MFIYLIECDNGKYYVGKTNNCKSRYKQHCNHKGSIWTRRYKPLRLLEVNVSSDGFDEDKYTKIYMNKYGIDNVRGGSYTQLYLPDHVKQLLQKEIMTATDLCYHCGEHGHFTSECVKKKNNVKNLQRIYIMICLVVVGFIGGFTCTLKR